jgi:hypothetical protein
VLTPPSRLTYLYQQPYFESLSRLINADYALLNVTAIASSIDFPLSLFQKQVCVPSEDLIREGATLVARGVRALTLLGQCEAAEEAISVTARCIADLACPGALPFVLDRSDGLADYGYAGALWAIKLYRWLQQTEIPPEQCQRILGLLFGYSVEAIE